LNASLKNGSSEIEKSFTG